MAGKKKSKGFMVKGTSHKSEHKTKKRGGKKRHSKKKA